MRILMTGRNPFFQGVLVKLPVDFTFVKKKIPVPITEIFGKRLASMKGKY